MNAPTLAVRKETDWNHMSCCTAPWAIDMHFTQPSTFGCNAESSRSFAMLADVERDSQSDSLQFIGKLWFESAVSVWCMDVRYREHEFKSQAERVACKWTTSSRVKVTQNRASYKMLQKAGRREGWGEKMTKSSVCVLTAFQVIYTEWKKEKNCVDFMSLLGENY